MCAGKLPRADYIKSLNKFLGLIKEHKEECHGIFVTGDLFDHKLSIDELEFASAFLVNLVCNGCGRGHRTHVPVYFIHGTYTHDYEQYEIFMPMLEKIDNTRVFYTNKACWGTLINGAKILYLPQEYGNVDYTELLSQSYDIIVGHGPLSSELKNPCPSTKYEIMHSAERLGALSKICVFGHFHAYTDFGDNVYYTGPWLRWKYGEDEPRVFFFCNDNYEVETVPNEFALEYETVVVNSPDELRSAVSQEINNPHRFIIHCNANELQEYHAIMNAYKKNPYLKYQITSESEEMEETCNIPESHIVKPIVEPVPALISYISEKYKVDATEKIKQYEEKINHDNKKEED